SFPEKSRTWDGTSRLTVLAALARTPRRGNRWPVVRWAPCPLQQEDHCREGESARADRARRTSGGGSSTRKKLPTARTKSSFGPWAQVSRGRAQTSGFNEGGIGGGGADGGATAGTGGSPAGKRATPPPDFFQTATSCCTTSTALSSCGSRPRAS